MDIIIEETDDAEETSVTNIEELEELLKPLYEYDVNKMTNLYLNCSNMELVKICHYYDFPKKVSKGKKWDIIMAIIGFEREPKNVDIILKRFRMWSYIEELSNDPKMKSYILW